MEYINQRDCSLKDKFESLEDYWKEAEAWINYLEMRGASCEEIHGFKKLLGLLPNEALKSIEIEGIGLIDEGIADIIEWLYNHGYSTLASCSGLQREHKVGICGSGYISFVDNERNRELIEALCSDGYDYKPTLSNTYFTDSISITFDEDGLIKLNEFIYNHGNRD